MKKSLLKRGLCLLLITVMLLSMMIGCGEKELAENEIAVKWRRGVVASDSHESGEAGLIKREDGYSYTDVITIPQKGTRITFVDDNTEGSVDVDFAEKDVFVISHWVEEDGEWVLDHLGDNYTGTGGRANEVVKRAKDSVTYSYVTSYDNEHIRLCYRSGQTAFNKSKIDLPRVSAEVTLEVGTLFASKSQEAKDLLVEKFLQASAKEQWNEGLKNLTVYAIGDSYFGGDTNGKEYVWLNLMAQKYEMKLENYGINGSWISNGVSPDGKEGHKPVCDRISQMAAGSPDIILLEGGRNDFNNSVTIGATNSTESSTFCGAINSCIDQLQAKYPGALIIGVTCWGYNATNKAGKKQADYGNAMLEVCAARGIPCFNAMDKTATGVDMDSKAFRSEYCQKEGDVSHLNTAGMVMVEPAFEKFIAEQYKAFK